MKYSLFLSCLIIMLSCSDISEDERLIYVKPAAVSRQVLIEDFTGQRCINCPNATDEIARLQELYGEDAIIAVAIHSGPLGFETTERFVGLKTQAGDEYYNHWNPEYQPIGMVDRSECVNYTLWNTLIREELQKTSPIEIRVGASVSDGKISVNTDVYGVDGDVSGKLQVWVIEDSIVAFQMMPDGTRQDNYLHMHVFREAVNGLWGDEITLKEGDVVTRQNIIAVKDEWQLRNVSIVAFLYNDKGVLQAARQKIKQ